MSKEQRSSKGLAYTLPSLVAAGGVTALAYLRARFQANQVFLPARYPDGVWDPRPYGVPAQDAWFTADDGVPLHGWWIPNPRRRAQATVLYCHGNTGSIADRVGIFRHLLRLKVDIFAFDYRGYGRSAGEPSEKGLFRDVRAAYRHLVGPLRQAPERTILFGHSLGGAVAIDGALDCPVAGLVVQSSFTDIKAMSRAVFPQLPIHLLTRNEFRSIDKVGRLAMPKLFIHGTEDGTIPFAQGRELYEAAAEPKELFVVPKAGHNDVHRFGGLSYLRRLTGFRRRCLAAARPAALTPSS